MREDDRVPVKWVNERRIKRVRIFRIGLDRLRQKILNHLGLAAEIGFLSCT